MTAKGSRISHCLYLSRCLRCEHPARVNCQHTQGWASPTQYVVHQAAFCSAFLSVSFCWELMGRSRLVSLQYVKSQGHQLPNVTEEAVVDPMTLTNDPMAPDPVHSWVDLLAHLTGLSGGVERRNSPWLSLLFFFWFFILYRYHGFVCQSHSFALCVLR